MNREINDKYENTKNDLPEPFYLDDQKIRKAQKFR